MKTSNKLLLGAFIVLLVGIITINFFLKKEVQKLKDNQTIELKDSARVDTVKNRINIQIN